MSLNSSTDILIIGGGISGCLLSLQLLRQHPQSKVTIIEKDPSHLGRGIAYGQHFNRQLLNVPVIGMSADPERPDHFFNWLSAHAKDYPGLVFDAYTFVPRSIYGDYIESEFKALLTSAGGQLQVVIDEALNAEKTADGFSINCKKTGKIESRFLVLSTGNLPPADISIKNASFLQSPLYVSNPWAPGVIAEMDPRKDILVIGSGLTAVDIVLALHDQQHKGKISLLSRRGKLPLPHAAIKSHQFSMPEALLSGDVKLIAKALRKEMKEGAIKGIDWQNIMDSIRPFTQKAWKQLTLEQKRIFLNRYRGFWEIHRHRVPAVSLEKINRMKASRQLVHYAGFVVDVREIKGKAELTYAHKNTTHTLTADLIINCTGPENNFRKNNMPLLTDMMQKGYVISDELNMGLGCDDHGRVINIRQEADPHCFCMGHLRKGTLWETTAVRELREQAREIAGTIVL